jgi:hypothetical protein
MNDFDDYEIDDEASYIEAGSGGEDDWGESDDIYDDLDLESLAEHGHPVLKKRYRGSQRRVSAPASVQPVTRTQGGTVRTPAGPVPLRFPNAVATAASVDARFQQIKREQAKQTGAINGLSKKVVTNTAMLDKKINALNADMKRTAQQNMQWLMLPLLLQSKPELASLTVKDAEGDIHPLEVTDQKFKQGDNTLLLPLVLMMSGMGGQDMSNNLLPLVLILGLGK